MRKLIAERLLLPEDGDLYIVKAWREETVKRFQPRPAATLSRYP